MPSRVSGWSGAHDVGERWEVTLELGEVQDTRFQEREWHAQRIAWLVLFVVIVGAALGLLGPGPLSLSQAQSPDDAVQAEYYRFARRGGDGTVTVTVAAFLDWNVDVWWNSAYLEEMTVNGVTPEPDSVTAIDGRVRYRFLAEPGDQLTVTFDITPDGVGAKRAEIAVADGTQRVTYDQFIYP
jgi:hypothetical protein